MIRPMHKVRQQGVQRHHKQEAKMLKRYKAIGAVLIAIVVFTIAAVAPAAAGTYGGWTYVVVRGDTLANIAGR